MTDIGKLTITIDAKQMPEIVKQLRHEMAEILRRHAAELADSLNKFDNACAPYLERIANIYEKPDGKPVRSTPRTGTRTVKTQRSRTGRRTNQT